MVYCQLVLHTKVVVHFHKNGAYQLLRAAFNNTFNTFFLSGQGGYHQSNLYLEKISGTAK